MEQNRPTMLDMMVDSLRGRHLIQKPMTLAAGGEPRRGMSASATVEIASSQRDSTPWYEDKFYRAAMSLVKHMRERGVIVNVGVNEPPFPHLRTLFVHVESGDKTLVPKKWRKLTIQLRGPLPCPTQPNQDLSKPEPAPTLLQPSPKMPSS